MPAPDANHQAQQAMLFSREKIGPREFMAFHYCRMNSQSLPCAIAYMI